MITEAQQYRIHQGDEKVFGEVFRATNMRVYHRALAALNDKRAARAVVIEAFTAFRKALFAANGPLDADALLYRLTDEAIDRVDALRSASPAETASAKHILERLHPSGADTSAGQAETVDVCLEDEVRYDGKKYKSKVAGNVLSLFAATLFALVFFWLLFGTLMRGGAMEYRDWGYTWFNEHILSWFNIRI